MEPKIVTKGAFKVLGMQAVGGKPEDVDFMGLWDQFSKRVNEISSNPTVYYGVCECLGENGFRYTASIEVADLSKIPANMVGMDIPEGRYAVFTHKGPFITLGETYRYIYEVWLPNSNEEQAYRPGFEYYDERFKCDSEGSEFDIYAPIK